MTINAFLTVYHSRRDVYGNVYHAITWRDADTGQAVSGTISADNVSTVDCRENLKWHVSYEELPIRQFNRLTKGWGYLGCTWEDIKQALITKKEERP